jgi:hypothetical protein
VGSSSGQRIFTGNFPSQYTDTVLTFKEASPLVGFFGSATGDKIYSVGQVVVETACSITADPNVTPIENINSFGNDDKNAWSQTTGLDATSTIYVASATTIVIMLVIGAAIGSAVYLKKKNKETTRIMHRASIQQR